MSGAGEKLCFQIRESPQFFNREEKRKRDDGGKLEGWTRFRAEDGGFENNADQETQIGSYFNACERSKVHT